MKRLAALALSGRVQAFGLAALIGFVPIFAWASAVVVALVALRKGGQEAVWPLAGAAIPAAMAWQIGDASFAGLLVVSLLGALVLANTRRLAWSLLSVTAAAFVGLLMITQFLSGQLAQMVGHYQEAIQQVAIPELQQVDVRLFAIQGIAWTLSWIAWITLLIARWLQAALYNPGGFRSEFHALRLTPAATGLLALALLMAQTYPALQAWVPVLMLPMVMAGLALVHGLVGLKKQGNLPLVLVYIGFLPPMVVLTLPSLMVAAVVDSFVNFRERVASSAE
jgi:hypothetical protein